MLQTRVDNSFDGWMRVKEAGERRRGLILEPDTQRERLQSSVQEETGVRIQTSTQMIQLVQDGGDAIGRTDDTTSDDVGMAVQILRGTVDLEIEPELEWVEIHGRSERIVDHRDETVFFRKISDRPQVGDAKERVGHSLDVDHAGVGAQMRVPILRICAVDRGGFDTRVVEVSEQAVCAPIQAILKQRVIAGSEEGQECGGNRGHPRGGDDALLATAQNCDLLLQCRMARGVVQADVAEVVVAVPTGVGKRRALVDRGSDGSCFSNDGFAGVDGFCFNVVELCVHRDLKQKAGEPPFDTARCAYSGQADEHRWARIGRHSGNRRLHSGEFERGDPESHTQPQMNTKWTQIGGSPGFGGGHPAVEERVVWSLIDQEQCQCNGAGDLLVVEVEGNSG